jgi:hypothetical protein
MLIIRAYQNRKRNMRKGRREKTTGSSQAYHLLRKRGIGASGSGRLRSGDSG